MPDLCGVKMFTKNNKVLFIVHDVYQEDNQFPLGLGYLAAILDKAGAKVESYCMDLFHYTNNQLAEHLDKNDYDIIGVGFMAARFKETIIGLCKTINKHKKNAWLVLGGHGPSPIPAYILNETKSDFVVIGEAEETIKELLLCKITRGNLSNINGIAYLKKGKLVITPNRKPIKFLDDIPFPLWDIFPIKKYTSCVKIFGQINKEKSLVILTSRGCVNKCNFCYRMESGIRLRSIGNIIDELKILYHKYGVNCYLFQDELFVLNKARLLNFEKALQEADLKIKFSCNARVDIIDKGMVQILKRIGCQFINLGLESSNDNVLQLMNKNTSVAQNIKAIETIREVGGIGIGLNFLWNNLGDNEETLKRNVEMIKKYNTYDQCRTIRPVTPYPGCDLYYKLIADGKLKGPKDFFDKFKNSDLMLVNLMNIPDKKAYELLLEANSELILDYYLHTQGDIEKAHMLIKNLADLYGGKTTTFRGTRHYSKK